MIVPKARQRLLFYYREIEEGMPKTRARARAKYRTVAHVSSREPSYG